MNENEIYSQIKNEILDIEANKIATSYINNRYDLSKYYNIGKLIDSVYRDKKYGNELIKEYASRLTNELGAGYSWRSLYYYKLYYNKFSSEILQPVAAKLSWSHYRELLSIDDDYEIRYYIDKCINNNYGRDKLRELIKSNEYQRLPDKSKEKINSNTKLNIYDGIVNPVIIKLDTEDKEVLTEKAVHKAIKRDSKTFLSQLGDGFMLIDDEYPIKMENRNNYIDFLLFNYIYNCFVVVELKMTGLKKEHLGQIQTYMNYINENKKQPFHKNTIGLILVTENNELILKYSSDPRIRSIEWIAY